MERNGDHPPDTFLGQSFVSLEISSRPLLIWRSDGFDCLPIVPPIVIVLELHLVLGFQLLNSLLEEQQ
jgi:hypothetical protein